MDQAIENAKDIVTTVRVMHDLGCVCGRHFRCPLFHALDVMEQPGLRYALLAGVLNSAQCPSCERISTVDLPFLYSDEARGHFYHVYPEGPEGFEGPRGKESDGWDVEAVRMITRGGGPFPVEGSRRPTVLNGVEPLVELIAAVLGEDEQPGSVLFDVRPGIKSERAARLVAGQIAVGVDGYAHSWREGGRLHLDVLGPTGKLETITVVMD